MKDTERLFVTVEQLRGELFSDLDPDLVREVLHVQVQFQDDRPLARQRTGQAIRQWASRRAAADEDGSES